MDNKDIKDMYNKDMYILETVYSELKNINYTYDILKIQIAVIKKELEEISIENKKILKENEIIIKNSKIFSNTITILQLVFFSILIFLNK